MKVLARIQCAEGSLKGKHFLFTNLTYGEYGITNEGIEGNSL
jgi:hypothetical protein